MYWYTMVLWFLLGGRYGGAVDDVPHDRVVLLVELLERGDDVGGGDHLDGGVDALLAAEVDHLLSRLGPTDERPSV